MRLPSLRAKREYLVWLSAMVKSYNGTIYDFHSALPHLPFRIQSSANFLWGQCFNVKVHFVVTLLIQQLSLNKTVAVKRKLCIRFFVFFVIYFIASHIVIAILITVIAHRRFS